MGIFDSSGSQASQHSSSEPPRKAPFKKGDFIGTDYEVYDVLGEGGFGIVYLVYSHELKSALALKTFRHEYLEDIKTRERFRKEAQIWIDLERHPYIVRVRFVKEISGRLYIAMEHIAADVPGMNTLEGYLRNRPPDLSQSLKWTIQFCHGMEHAYSKGVKAHRDIKPANIMIGQDKAVKISDFGLAGISGTSNALSGLKLNTPENISKEAYQTMVGTAFGTPPYMPPEQFENATACDKRSDIYSFGIVLYQMASGGKLPFYPAAHGSGEGDAFQKWYTLHCKATIPKLKSPLFPVILKCLEKEPRKRYQTFKELRADLEPLLKRETGEIVKLPELKEMEAWELGNKGVSLKTLGKYQEAIACYDEAIEINPIYAEAWSNKGNAFAYLVKHQEAIACYDKALKINPRLAETWSNKGNILDTLGKGREAIACYDEALEINPIYAGTWYGKGNVFANLVKPREAIACYDEALKINPIYAEAWSNKGNAFAYLVKHQEAISCYDKALEINPRDAVAWGGKGVAEDKLNRTQEAIISYKQFLELASERHAALIAHARNRIEELERK